jgi:hypothetical protein
MLGLRLSTKIWCSIIFLFFIIQNQNTYAQQDSTENAEFLREDMARERSAKKAARRKKFLSTLPKNHNPKTATLLALIPGVGQIYNRRYWKLPIVYAGFGVFGYFTVANYVEYGCYRKAYLHAVDSDPNTTDVCPTDPLATEGNLKIYRDNARESAEFFVLGFTLFYGLTIIDAFVDAHLMYFDISDDLSMSIQPSLNYNLEMRSMVAGVGLSVQPRIKKTSILPVRF